jgi:hypothetical protein
METYIDASMMLKSGVYILLYKGRMQYVGKASLPLRRIGQHQVAWLRRKQGKPFNGQEGFPFDEIRVMPCPKQDLDRVEREMIMRCRPKYNKHLGLSWEVGGRVRLPESRGLTLKEAGFDIAQFLKTKVAPEFVRRY